MKDKIFVSIVSRNNPVLLEHAVQSFEKFDAGYDFDLCIVDQDSDNDKQLKLCEKLSKKYIVQSYTNDRVEVSFDRVWREYSDYKYYLFLHDDSSVNHDGWLRVFIDRMQSKYCENIISNTHLRHYPIGKIGISHHFWRSYSNIIEHPSAHVQCLFLKDCLEVLGKVVPQIFKYTDCDRSFITNECLIATSGLRNMSEIKQWSEEQRYRVQQVFDKYLNYPDDGIGPKDKYPAGYYWHKYCLLMEMMNSIEPLNAGYRVVGLYGDGYLENVHGYDTPICHEYITHYGSPNFIEFIAKNMNVEARLIRQHLNEKVFLMKCDKLIKDYLWRK